jgi:hypothetical protein
MTEPTEEDLEKFRRRRGARSEAETLRLADIGRSVVREREREMKDDNDTRPEDE